jgi:hypothetical protein
MRSGIEAHQYRQASSQGLRRTSPVHVAVVAIAVVGSGFSRDALRHVAKGIGHECLSYQEREGWRGFRCRLPRFCSAVGSGFSRDAFRYLAEGHRA